MPDDKSLEERFEDKAGDIKSTPKAEAAAEAYFSLNSNSKKSLDKLHELGAISAYDCRRYQFKLEKLEIIKDPALRAKELIGIYELIKRLVSHFIGTEVAVTRLEESAKPGTHLAYYTEVGSFYLKKYEQDKPAGKKTKEQEIYSRVKEIIAMQLNLSEEHLKRVNYKTEFIKDLSADSLDLVELIMEFEDQFRIAVPDEEAEKIETVEDAVNYLMRNTD